MTDQNQLIEELRYARLALHEIYWLAVAHRDGNLPPTAFSTAVGKKSWAALQQLPYRGEPQNLSADHHGQEGVQNA